ncbi:MAG TPA: methyltransferase domain-containing protein [Candidatus Cybelea sp.]|jgi:SAM-dependent methyltransferase
MRVYHRHAAEAAYAQPLTEELVVCSGISPGMKVLVLGRGIADVALLVAERVGPHGAVIGSHEDPQVVNEARRRAAEECSDRVTFAAEPFEQMVLDAPVDAVVGRFFLMHERDPVGAIRRASSMVHDGGRVIFQEWQYDSILRPQTSAWPDVPLYREFAQRCAGALSQRGAHLDMGLRLVNAFTEAGLPVPDVRTEIAVVHGSGSLGYAFFEDALREWLDSAVGELDLNAFAQRLEHETSAAQGHLFLPLQVGAWARVVRPG